MASPQADCRGVAAEAVAFQASFERIRAYAGELLDFAEREYARLPVHRTCELPDASLEIGFSAAEFAELCDRAYVQRRPAAAGARKVRLTVLDHASLPGTPRWEGPAPARRDGRTRRGCHRAHTRESHHRARAAW